MVVLTRVLSRVFIGVSLVALVACSGSDENQSAAPMNDHSTMNHDDMDNMAGGQDMTVKAMGRVVKISPTDGMITIEHGPIEAMKWPTMIMPFMTAPEHLSAVKVGDFVDMEMASKPNTEGKYVLTSLSPLHVDPSKLSPDCMSQMKDIKSLDHRCMADIWEAMPHGH